MLPASNEHASCLQPYEPLHAVPAVDGATVHPRQQDENTVATIQELATSLEHLEASLATAHPSFELQAICIAQITLDRDALRASIDASRKNLRHTFGDSRHSHSISSPQFSR
ncbi:hypothetical protein EXIGLDRAFT_731109 [Exidia glandulosa HHB12029]|uniref:Uncharacterized protein n=1 Tax=Exidia glandulosa HHB12029 TaxID=1314781 RepID=A0A165ZD08_EXIGL|nr:hypothetical protein EXIGLDRAFT_731109 [Exidia glandulosa HHB12029]